ILVFSVRPTGGRTSARLFKPRDDVHTFLGVRDAGEDHCRTRHVFHRVREKPVECFFAPYNFGMAHSRGIVKSRNSTSAATEHATMPGSDAILSQGVACHAAGIDLLAIPGIACRFG